MAKKNTGAAIEQEDDGRYSVVIEPDLAARIKRLVGFLDMTRPNWINSRLRAIIEQEEPDVLARHGLQRIQPEQDKKG